MGGKSVFLVEDEALIRMMIVEMLDELGHRVVAEAGSIEAAEPLARTSVFDLAVFDINVAGFNISPIAEIVAARSLPFVFVSGYGPAGRSALFADRPILRKPFLIEHFADMINSATNNHPPWLRCPLWVTSGPP
jgi:CheY-like chemotaxis protein